jgi:hypothetical protein
MRNNPYLAAGHVLIFILLIALTTGCATVRMNDFYIDSPQAKIPIRAGLYLNPVFRSPAWTDYSHTFPLDKEMAAGMAQGAEKVLKDIFQELHVIDQGGVLAQDRYGVQAIVTPEIVEPGIVLKKRGGFWTEGQCEFVCKWTIYSTDGKILYMNTFVGTGKDSSFVGDTRINKGMTLAIKDNYQKFIDHMLSTKWWEGVKR